MKYVSIDLETTGLDPVHNQIIEFAAVLDDIQKGSALHGRSVRDLPVFRAIVVNEEGELNFHIGAIEMHQKSDLLTLWKACHRLMFEHEFDEDGAKDIDIEGIPYNVDVLGDEALFVYNDDMEDVFFIVTETSLASTFREWLADHEGFTEPLTAAGKNFGTFDLQFLLQLPDWDIEVRHRILDVGSMYVRETDEVIPNTAECLARAGLSASVTHRAREDAMDVVQLVRMAFLQQAGIRLNHAA